MHDIGVYNDVETYKTGTGNTVDSTESDSAAKTGDVNRRNTEYQRIWIDRGLGA